MGGSSARDDRGELDLEETGLYFPMGGGAIKSEVRRLRDDFSLYGSTILGPRLRLRLLNLL